MLKEIIIYATLILFLFVGVLFRKKIKNFKEYALGGKPISKLALSATVTAIAIGGESTIGSVSQVHEIGLVFMPMLLCIPISLVLFSYLIPKIKSYYGCISMPEMISKMYGGNIRLRQHIGGVSFVFLLGALSMQVKSLSSFFTSILGYNGEISAIISFIIIVAYTSTKGIVGVIKTDILQFFIFIIILPIITIFLVQDNGHNIENLITSVPQESFKKNISWWSIIAIIIGFCLPDDTPDMMHRFLLTKDVNKLKSAINLLSLITVLSTIMVIIIGAIGLIKYPNDDSNQMIFIVIKNFLNNEVLYSLFGIALAAVIISTADSVINTASVIFVNDILLKSQQKSGLFFARITCIAIGVLSILITLNAETIFGIILFFAQLYNSAIFVPFVFGLFKYNKTPIMFWSSSLLGIISYIIVYLLPLKLEEATFLISLSVSIISYIIFSEKPLKFILNKTRLLFYIQNVNNKIKISQLSYTMLPISLWIITSDIATGNFSFIELSIVIINLILIFFTFHFALTITLLIIYYRWDKIILRLMLCCFCGLITVVILNNNSSDISSQITRLSLMILYICASSIIFFRKNDKMLEDMQIMGSIIAHEIRGPLSSIAGNMVLLLNEKNNNLINENLNIIKRAQNNIETFIVNIKQNYDLILELTCLGKLIREALNDYGLTNEEWKLIQYKEIKNNNLIKLDKFLVKQVIVNLIKNALYQRKKYQRGNIKIEAYENKIVVYDDIIGIDEKFIPYIFHHFTTTNKDGSGLGLAFCKYAMEKMNGRRICESKMSEYTKFTLIFSISE
ncbi:sodium:solute symporter family transporter [Rickettsiales endosymbiont of Trichoplax sp. H2]|uniref:sodium:solute symporter family transporter n=1 Tax=Rickettsiales endosymbiont of Trichoplax sp. H2 TaxID=2021221 RepID=UPI0012B355E0|nr:ATP-binding protein [Rickettsiales endosymbiont of Trichoplax sp. H2]MSO14594.1 CAI-1 autoinducer sensor kinase/phosphatase CqsS [Rickettsiales endosymbiont of Trichoplax sp. H2]